MHGQSGKVIFSIQSVGDVASSVFAKTHKARAPIALGLRTCEQADVFVYGAIKRPTRSHKVHGAVSDAGCKLQSNYCTNAVFDFS